MQNKKSFKRTISLGIATVVLVGAGLLSGCTSATTGTADSSGKPDDKSPAAVQDNKQDKVMPEFIALLGENTKPDVLLAYMDKHIAEVSEADASRMLQEVFKAQSGYLTLLENKYYDGASIQESLNKVYKPGFDLSKVEDIQDAELKKLLLETRDMGYKVETAEGMYFPIMNYENLKKYSPYATSDMKDYVDIMAVETNKVPAKDAALVIGWDEVVARAMTQERFLNEYGSSSMAGQVKELNKKYQTFILYGLNNTPLFSYDAKVMDPEAKKAYLEVSKLTGNSKLLNLLKQYMLTLEKSGYKLTDEVEKFRKEAAESY